MKKNKGRFKKWLRYKFDNYIAKGVKSQFLLLFLTITLAILIFGTCVSVLSRSLTFRGGLWQALIHIIDQGTITADDTKERGYIVLMLLVTFMGMTLTGSVVGIINNALTNKLNELRRGHSRIIEKGHVVIIGFNETVYTLIAEMEESNRNWPGNKKIVVVDDMSRDDIEHRMTELEHYLNAAERTGRRQRKKMKNHTIFRSGSLVSDHTFEMAAIEDARAIIINHDDDFTVIRVMLAVVAYLKKHDAYFDPEKVAAGVEEDYPAIVTLMHKAKNITAAKIAAGLNVETAKHQSDEEQNIISYVGKADGTKVRVLYFENILAHIFAQVCREPGLSWVLSELFDYQNSELYIESVDKDGCSLSDSFDGRTFGDISEMMVNSIAVGIQKGRRMLVNPSPDVRFEKGDKIIHLAVDDNEIELAPEKRDVVVAGRAAGHQEKAYHLLVFGWSKKLPEVLTDIDRYAAKGSTVHILSRNKDAGTVLDGQLERMTLYTRWTREPYDWDWVSKDLDEMGVWEADYRPTNIIILCQDDDITKTKADERATVLLLNIRHFLTEMKLDNAISITTELNMPEDQHLLEHKTVNDFIVGSEIANRMMVQVANNPDIFSVFVELLRDQGSELALRHISEYVDESADVSFHDLERIVRSRGRKNPQESEVLLGWIRSGGELEHPEVRLNPLGDERFKPFSKKEGNLELVVLIKNPD
ncbi:MAG: hypothetical protein Q4B73_08550 [Lachnospiraceae bacterium]|nr:hypothetical protein [Lachnospiraceae bacterium]